MDAARIEEGLSALHVLMLVVWKIMFVVGVGRTEGLSCIDQRTGFWFCKSNIGLMV